MAKEGFVYILASGRNGTLYVGVTSNLLARIYLHRTGEVEGFSKKYNVKRLVYFEKCQSMYEAIAREKVIKNWRRKWKLDLIERVNPEWVDLYPELI